MLAPDYAKDYSLLLMEHSDCKLNISPNELRQSNSVWPKKAFPQAFHWHKFIFCSLPLTVRNVYWKWYISTMQHLLLLDMLWDTCNMHTWKILTHVQWLMTHLNGLALNKNERDKGMGETWYSFIYGTRVIDYAYVSLHSFVHLKKTTLKSYPIRGWW